MPNVTLRYFDHCPNWRTTDADLAALADEFDLTVRRERVADADEADHLRFRGSPTVLVAGRDPFARGDEPVGLSCRVYQTPDGPAGAPTRSQLRAALTAHPDLDTLATSIAGALPDLPAPDRRLIDAIYRSLAAGTPADPATLADANGAPREHVTARLEEWPGVFRDDDGAVVGFWGLAIPPLPHRVTFDGGAQVHAWCAYDPLFLAPLIGPAEVTTTDPVSGATIAYRLGPAGTLAGDDQQVVSFLLPEDRWDGDVLASFCHFVHHFEDRTNGEIWCADHPGTFLLPLAEAAELGRRHADLLR